MKDSFDAVNKIKNTPPHLFDDRYNYVSFDMGSLSTNVPVKRIIDIILKRLYIDKVISINLKKRSMKKPQLETCTKTVFAFNGVLYEQKDGVCVVSSFLNNLDPFHRRLTWKWVTTIPRFRIASRWHINF